MSVGALGTSVGGSQMASDSAVGSVDGTRVGAYESVGQIRRSVNRLVGT